VFGEKGRLKKEPGSPLTVVQRIFKHDKRLPYCETKKLKNKNMCLKHQLREPTKKKSALFEIQILVNFHKRISYKVLSGEQRLSVNTVYLLLRFKYSRSI
jgi:hypothetical protein